MEYLLYQRDPLEKIRVWAVFNAPLSLSNGVSQTGLLILCFFKKYLKVAWLIPNAFEV
jgi:hypothetical protein